MRRFLLMAVWTLMLLASCEKKPQNIAVTGLSLDKTTVELTEGENIFLKATVMPSDATDKSVSWSSSDAAVASVSNGTVSALKAGSANITVRSNDGGKTASCSVKVIAKYVAVTSVNVTDTTGNTSGTLKVGGTMQLKVEILPVDASDRNFTWSATTDCAKVDTNGLVTALKIGDCVIRANAADKKTGEYCVSIPRINVRDFKIVDAEGNTEGEVVVGSTVQLSAVITPEDVSERNIQWSSSKSDIASVDDNGLVTAKGVGEAVITAIVNRNAVDSKEAQYKIYAKALKVTSIEVTPAKLALTEGTTSTLSAKVLPENASIKSVTWSSSNTAVATVDEDGTVTALKEGKARIYAGAKDDSGVSGCCELTVEPDKTLKGISLSSEAMELEIGEQKTLTVTFVPSCAANRNIIWSSSNTSVATVADGMVKGIAEGTAIITATSEEGGFTATCTVTVKESAVEGTKVLYVDINENLYLDGEIFATRVKEFASYGNDIFYYSWYWGGIFRNDEKIFNKAEFNLDNESVYDMKVAAGKLYLYISDQRKSIRLLIIDIATGEKKNVTDFIKEQPMAVDYLVMDVAGDGTAWLAAQVRDQYNEYSSRLWKVRPDGTSEETVFYRVQESVNGIRCTEPFDVEVSDVGDVYALIDKEFQDSSLPGFQYHVVLFKNGTAYRTYEGYNANFPQSVTCCGNDVYAMLTRTDGYKTDMYRNDDVLKAGIKSSAMALSKSIAVDKNTADLYYIMDDGDKCCVYKNDTKLYSCDCKIGSLELMY